MPSDWNTPDLCDTHPQLRVAAPLFRHFGGAHRFHGRIRSVRCFEDNSRVRDCLAEPGAGQVLVVDGAGSLRRALLGDQLAAMAVGNGWRGLLIHGCVRDVDALAQLPLGVLAVAACPMKTEKRGLGEIDVPVTFAGMDFVPGQWLYADRNGVVVADAELPA